MATARNALLQIEAGQSFTDFTALTDSGDHKNFGSPASQFSKADGKEPVIRPNGLATGGAITPNSAADKIDVAALTCYLAGAKISVAAESGVDLTRATTDGYSIVNSVTVNASGEIAIVAGTEGAVLNPTGTRGGAGAAPWIPTGSIEIGQVHLDDDDAAVVKDSEIKAVIGTHVERYDYPVFRADHSQGEVNFSAALPAIHSDDAGSTTAAKKVYASFYEPEFMDIPETSDFKPPEETHSQNSTQIYGGTIGASSSTLGQGTFTAYLDDGLSDAIINLKNDTLWFRYYPNRMVTDKYLLCQGRFGISREFPADSGIRAACTISAESPAVEVTP